MRVRSAIKRLCDSCRVVKRRGKLYIVCKASPKHKQRQGYHTEAQAPAIPSTAAPASNAGGFGASIGMQEWLASSKSKLS